MFFAGEAPEDIPAADHKRHFDPGGMDGFDLLGHAVNDIGIQIVTGFFIVQGLSAQLQEDSFILGCEGLCHGFLIARFKATSQPKSVKERFYVDFKDSNHETCVMSSPVVILIIEALCVYFLVLWAHSLRHRFGPVHFYALMGGLTAVMSWVTDAGMRVEISGIYFNVGSTVFYTALLLGVFVIYVFDGPRTTRILISTIIGVSIMVPLISLVLHLQDTLLSGGTIQDVPMPSLRINVASVVATMLDLIFLAIVWEILGKPGLRIKLGPRTFLTLLGVMWLDVLLFTTGAFVGTDAYWGIMKGTMISRFFISVAAFPMLYIYINLQSRHKGVTLENRPVLSILKEIADITEELHTAHAEIKRRIEAEAALTKALSEVKTLRGFLPICSGCKKIRDDHGYWQQIELYIREHSDAEFSHGLCPECLEQYYPDLPGEVSKDSDVQPERG